MSGTIAKSTSILRAAKLTLREAVVARLGGELDPTRIAAGTDPGWFGPESSAWKIHADACLLVGGVAALLHQTLHPLAMAGVADHSAYVEDPWGRLRRTSAFLAEVIYGDTALAEHNIANVRRIHAHIYGTSPDGRRYRADDPELLTYIHATEVRAFLRSYQRHGGLPLTQAEADTYVYEMGRIAIALGASSVPQDQKSLDDCLDTYKADLAFGSQAAEALRFLRNPGLSPIELVAYQGIFDAGCALLDETEAELLGVGRERRRGRTLRSGEVASCGLRWVLGTSKIAETAKRRVETCTN